MDSAVTPEVFASAAAWVSVGAAMARRGWVVEKGREFRVIVDEVGLDILKAVRKIEARASIGLAGRRARRCTKDVGRVLRIGRIRNPSFETATSGRRLTLRHGPLWRASEAYLRLGGRSPNTDMQWPLYFPSKRAQKRAWRRLAAWTDYTRSSHL
jgi:hypothetical protein